jgi:hypothetical protein
MGEAKIGLDDSARHVNFSKTSASIVSAEMVSSPT